MTRTIMKKVATPFGSMYVYIDFNERGFPCGGAISDLRKKPDAQIAQLVNALSRGLDDLLRDVAEGA